MERFFAPRADPGVTSAGQELVRVFEYHYTFGTPKRFDRFLSDAVRWLESSWYEIAGRYMTLKIESLGK